MSRFKASETLLGIETHSHQPQTLALMGFKASETLLGIETEPIVFDIDGTRPLQSL